MSRAALLVATGTACALLALLCPGLAAARTWPRPPPWWMAQAACIAHYESTDNTHDRSNPSSRGLYQFEYGTWASVGGVGDPADASRPEQTYRAWLVYKRDHNSWREWSTAPDCGLR